MTSLREMRCDDLFKFNVLVFDCYTEIYRLGFYQRYIGQFPDLAIVAVAPNGQLAGFILGKLQPGRTDVESLHGHVCVLTVSSECRRVRVASLLMNDLIRILNYKQAWYVDLYLRCSNQGAFNLYREHGYQLRRILIDYYPGEPEEDAYDMRKPLAIDKDEISVTMASKDSVRLPSEEESDEEDYFESLHEQPKIGR